LLPGSAQSLAITSTSQFNSAVHAHTITVSVLFLVMSSVH
jgi:hypothetical protein